MATVDARVPRQFPTAPSGSSGSNGRAAPTIAERADALAVYEDAVQEPALECGNLASLYYNAQDLGSRRPEARVLREDFCSSAIVAQTWVGLDEGHRRAQGVDVDLRALEVARRRATRPGRKESQAPRVVLLQSGQYGDGHKARVVEAEEQHEAEVKREGERQEEEQEQGEEQKESKPEEETTWSVGATTDRFERRFQARLRRQQEQAAKEKARESLTNAEEDDLSATPALTLMHADVLSLPLPLPLDVRPVAAPDIVYAGNYALSYFHTRPLLIAYLAQVARTLRRGTGCLIVDPFAGPTSWSSSATEQAALWSAFSAEPGFLRGPGDPPVPVSDDAALQFWSAPPSQADGGAADWRRWPRGNLVKVRRGALFGGYDYYREDSPLDHASNRFRWAIVFFLSLFLLQSLTSSRAE